MKIKEEDIIDYLKTISVIDIIDLIAKQTKFDDKKNENEAIYYTAKDLYKLYPNVFSKYKLNKYIKDENLPVIKNGKDRLFLKSSIEEWLTKKSNFLLSSKK